MQFRQGMGAMFFRRRREAVQALYESVLRQARSPAFFGPGRAPDTVDGRFEVLALHLALVIRRLQTEGKKGQAIAQDLFDIFVRDMDANLRELGASDSRFGKKMRHIVESFYGRAKSYTEALDSGGEAGLRDALVRNMFDGAVSPAERDRMAAYCLACAARLSEAGLDDWFRGGAIFPPPPPD